jgi:hypothetical protein
MSTRILFVLVFLSTNHCKHISVRMVVTGVIISAVKSSPATRHGGVLGGEEV